MGSLRIGTHTVLSQCPRDTAGPVGGVTHLRRLDGGLGVPISHKDSVVVKRN